MIVLGSAKDTEYSKLLKRPDHAGGVTMSVYIVVDDGRIFERARAAARGSCASR